ncbi:MAG: amidohydrolase family protein, partial [Erysipelotrichaceae bacterium]|nr:amidohydrolase family protein [Erysipelotrichaceae bacterium]
MKEGDLEVTIDERGFCLTDTGRLCGSTLPVIRGVKNLVENMNIPLETVLKMCSLNPAKVYNLTGKGELKAGNDADFVVIDDDFTVLHTYSLGKEVYNHTVDTHLFNESFLDLYKL